MVLYFNVETCVGIEHTLVTVVGCVVWIILEMPVALALQLNHSGLLKFPNMRKCHRISTYLCGTIVSASAGHPDWNEKVRLGFVRVSPKPRSLEPQCWVYRNLATKTG